MKLNVTPSAVEWLGRELRLQPGQSVRFFAKYGGHSHIQPGFSIGLTVESPQNVAVSTNAGEFLFFIREEDVWFFDGHNLTVDSSKDDDIEYIIGD